MMLLSSSEKYYHQKVKIDPQSIGVGLYQHDVDQKRMKIELQGVVEDCARLHQLEER